MLLLGRDDAQVRVRRRGENADSPAIWQAGTDLRDPGHENSPRPCRSGGAPHRDVRVSGAGSSRAARDWALRKQAARIRMPEVIWTEDEIPTAVPLKSSMQAAAE